jgi:hypothetical protein
MKKEPIGKSEKETEKRCVPFTRHGGAMGERR